MFEAYIIFVLVQLIGLRFLIRQTALLGCRREPRVIDYPRLYLMDVFNKRYVLS